MRWAQLLLACLLVGLAVPAGAADTDVPGQKKDEPKAGLDTVVVTDKDAGGKVTVKEGGTLQVKLRVAGGTPFAWFVVRFNDTVLEPKGKPTYE